MKHAEMPQQEVHIVITVLEILHIFISARELVSVQILRSHLVQLSKLVKYNLMASHYVCPPLSVLLLLVFSAQ